MGRFVKLDDERFWLNRMHQDKVMKDLNYLMINKEKDNSLLQLSRADYNQLKIIIDMDSEFLMKHNLMDYSLLVVIEQEKSLASSYYNSGKQLLNMRPKLWKI